MDELGYCGPVTLEGNFLLSIIARNSSDVPTTPTGTPTYRIYANDPTTTIDTGSLDASDQDSNTGFRTNLIACTTANGYTAGTLYTFLVAHTVSGSAKTARGTFMVV